MDLHINFGGRRWRADLSQPHDLSIPLDFSGRQPRCFGAAAAHEQTYVSASFVGDVRRGGSCNCATYTFTPHCNGTHTECVGHLTRESVSVRDIAVSSLMVARLLSVEPTASSQAVHAKDLVITLDTLQRAGTQSLESCQALVLRTLPNEPDKLVHNYDVGPPPPYIDPHAMQWLVECGIEHLLIDLPSVDRMDDSRLPAHRAFWGMPAAAMHLTEAARPHATITELIYAAAEIPDGLYLLNLQVAPFVADAAPSRPVLYSLVPA